MKRSSFLKSFGAVVVGLAFTPFVGTAKSQADLDTEEVQSILDNGGILRDRVFRINRPLVWREDAPSSIIERCRFIVDPSVRGPVLNGLGAPGSSFSYNIIDGSHIGLRGL